jgi:hypothetical protein
MFDIKIVCSGLIGYDSSFFRELTRELQFHRTLKKLNLSGTILTEAIVAL